MIILEKAKLIFGGFCISGVIATYGIYMAFGPGGDGAIFGSVIGAIGLLAGGIAGFEFGFKKGSSN